ncbi:MAG TPA: hypothetical protein VLK65_19620 [Vicinamibacteria bacterium]|nr:hypothetical protein [Vicinamibacteria bacterium]
MPRSRLTRWTVLLITTGAFGSALFRGTARAWNDAGHRLTLEKAIDALPKPLKSFYENRRVSLGEAICDPTRFGPRLVFEVDRLEPFPFEGLPIDRKLAVRKYGEETIEEAGDVPWRIIESYEALVEAFSTGDFEAAADQSVAIAYYVGELYVPANVSRLGDGEPTSQQGLRERFDSRLLDAFSGKLNVSTPNAIYLDQPADYAVSIPLKSFIWVDNLLYFDYLSRRGVKSYDRFYYEGMWTRAKPVLESLLGGAALDASSFWYTAWVNARKPDLPKK